MNASLFCRHLLFVPSSHAFKNKCHRVIQILINSPLILALIEDVVVAVWTRRLFFYLQPLKAVKVIGILMKVNRKRGEREVRLRMIDTISSRVKDPSPSLERNLISSWRIIGMGDGKEETVTKGIQ